MPSYFYVIKNSSFENADEHGTALRDAREAQFYALRIIRELKEGGGYDDGDWIAVIFAENGRRVCTVPFSVLANPNQARKVS